MNEFTVKYTTEGKYWNLEDALNDEDWVVRETAIRRPNATPEHISKALNHEDWSVRNAAKERLSK
jgi:HEAT repeat protein